MRITCLGASLGVPLLVAALATPFATAPLQAQDADTFRWSGPVASARWVTVRNLNGDVRVERATGRDVEIVARKRWTRGNPADVRITMVRGGAGDGDVVVCALWGENGHCGAGDEYRAGRSNVRGNVSVEFTIRVPDGVKLDLRTTNGALAITGATAEVRAHTVNGGIDARSLGGPVLARTTNGGINVRMGDSGSEDLEYSTTNGSIEIELPDGLNADVEMRTTNGGIASDFPLTVQGRWNSRRVNGRIGQGGRRLVAKTTNGEIALRRS